MQETQVLIIGGGASGLTASMLLSRYGVQTCLVSKYQETSSLPKAHLLSIKTMEMYRELGVEDAIRAQATPAENMRHVAWFAGLSGPHADYGREIARLGAWGRGGQDPDWAAASDNCYANLMQARLEPLLRARAEQLAPDSTHFYHAFQSFREDGDGIVATILDRATEQTYEVRARYLLACDGGQTIGPQLGVEMQGHPMVATNISVHFSADLSRWARGNDVLIRTILNPDTGEPGVLVPMGPDQWGPDSTEWAFHLISFVGDHKQDDDAAAVARMLRTLGISDLQPQVHKVTRWPLHATVASRFRVGRVFILGDAAHRMPPSGGHGLNSAVQDCYNLCWKLAAVLRDQAGDALLDTYEQERRPVAQRTVDSAFRNWENARRFAAALDFSPAHTPQQNWNNLRLQWSDDAAGDAARQRAAAGLTIPAPTYQHLNISFGYTYATGALVPDDVAPPPCLDEEIDFRPSTKPGHSLPHAWLGDTRGRYSINTLVGQGRLVLIAGEAGQAWITAARQLAHQHGLALEAIMIGTECGDHLDLQREWLKRRQFGPSGAILVRPDRFVAWRAMTLADDPLATLAAALQQVLRRD